MATINEITNSILLAKAYQNELTDALLEAQINGCTDINSQSQINRLENLIISLESRIERNVLDDNTDVIYSCLLTAIANYSGSSLSIDPNASVPSIIIDVINTGNNLPDWIDVPWSAMTNDVAGYRDTYFNADWIGLNPAIQIPGVTMYVVGVDYDNDGNGNITFRAGKGLYDGQYFRAGNYQAYTPLPTGGYVVDGYWVDGYTI